MKYPTNVYVFFFMVESKNMVCKNDYMAGVNIFFHFLKSKAYATVVFFEGSLSLVRINGNKTKRGEQKECLL